jgi:lipopolysaccharide heptosyltransferase II
MVTLPQTAALATLDPDVDTVITIDTNAIRSVRGLLSIRTFSCILHAVKELRHQKFDATVSVYGLTASVLAMLTRSSRRLGYADEAYAGALDETVPGGRVGGMLRQHDWEFTKGLVDRVADTVSRRSAAAPQDSSPPLSHREAFPRIEVQEETRISAQRLLDASGVDRRKTLVVLHAGSRYGDFKRWPAGSYAQVARDLAAAGCEVVLVGAESDAPLASEIAAGAGVQSLAGRTTLEQLCAILARADLVISGDSGPLHLATAMGTKVIGLYGPTDPEVNGPRSWRGQEVLVLRRDIVCSPCYSVRVRAECPLGDPICMRLVPPETVLKAAAQMLDLWHGVKIKE